MVNSGWERGQWRMGIVEVEAGERAEGEMQRVG
jgi:hypothetical protein